MIENTFVCFQWRLSYPKQTTLGVPKRGLSLGSYLIYEKTYLESPISLCNLYSKHCGNHNTPNSVFKKRLWFLLQFFFYFIDIVKRQLALSINRVVHVEGGRYEPAYGFGWDKAKSNQMGWQQADTKSYSTVGHKFGWTLKLEQGSFFLPHFSFCYAVQLLCQVCIKRPDSFQSLKLLR